MGALSIFTGIGYRLWLYGPLILNITLYVSAIILGIEMVNEADSKKSSGDGFAEELLDKVQSASLAVMIVLYLIPAGIGIGGVFGFAWIITSPRKNVYLWAVLGLSLVYMALSLFLFFDVSEYAVIVGLPITWLLLSIVLGISREKIFADSVKAKAVIIVGLAFVTCYYLLAVLGDSIKTVIAAFACCIIGAITVDVGYGIGWRAIRRSEQKKEDVILIQQAQAPMYVHASAPVNYGSVTIVTA
jgi:hypothetical protein